MLILRYYAFNKQAAPYPPHLDTHFGRTPVTVHPTIQLLQFVLLLFIHLPIVATPLTRLSYLSHSFQDSFVVSIHDAPDICPPLDPALNAVHFFFFFSLVLPPPLVVSLYLSHVHSYSVHIHVHSIICVHTVPRRRFLQANQTLYNMLSPDRKSVV